MTVREDPDKDMRLRGPCGVKQPLQDTLQDNNKLCTKTRFSDFRLS
jgi:hypothetical protein